ncbi:MAG: hypothetical protein CVU48_00450 [Candidatus Cloacimonetes bacterium HGW-Cloacimonetes-1]|nr:MAG: hypothetical protein CVU48_00450 [Candidatus Cloacimonetes bacterium HGW-Cloacimonetes-1]
MMISSFYSIIMMLSTVLSVLMLENIRHTSSFLGKRPLSLLLGVLVGWCFFAAMEISASTLGVCIFWAKMIFVSNLCFGVLYLWFVLEFSRLDAAVVRKWIVWLSIFPLFALTIAFINSMQFPVWEGFRFDAVRNMLVIDYGVWYWITIGYQLLLVLTGMMILYTKCILRSPNSKKAIWILLSATILPLLASLVYLYGITLLRVIPLSIFLSVSLVFYGIVRLRMFDLIPVARHKLIDKMHGAMLVLDMDLRLRDINNSAIKLLGVTKKDIGIQIVSRISEFSFLNAQPGSHEDLNLDMYLAQTDKWFDITISALGKEENRGLLIILRDISAKKRDEAKLIQLNSELTAQTEKLTVLNDQKNKLFSIIAHDLKNPFHQIIGFSDVLAKNAKKLPLDEIEDIAITLLESATHGKHILEDLLTWSRSLMHSIPFNPELLDPAEYFHSVVASMKPLAAKKNISFESDIASGHTLFADKNMFAVVLRNFIGNAIKFSHPGGKITVQCSETEELCRICVIDQGLGMDAEHMSKLFGLGQKKSTTGTMGETGTGLGLVLCKEFAEQSGGEILVESEPGKGSTFCFTVPKTGNDQDINL